MKTRLDQWQKTENAQRNGGLERSTRRDDDLEYDSVAKSGNVCATMQGVNRAVFGGIEASDKRQAREIVAGM